MRMRALAGSLTKVIEFCPNAGRIGLGKALASSTESEGLPCMIWNAEK